MPTDAQMNFAEVAAALQLPAAHEVWQAAWPETRATAQEFAPQFTETALREAGALAHLGEEATASLLNARAALDDNPALAALAAHVAVRLHRPETCAGAPPEAFPPMPAHLGAAAHAFYAWVALAGVAQVRARHREVGIPREITADTLRDLNRAMTDYHDAHGVWGLDRAERLRPLFTAHRYELGGLQFSRATWKDDYHFFRNTLEPGVVAFTGDGRSFDATGRQCMPAPGGDAWEAHFHLGHKIIRGNPVTPAGRAITEMVSLPTVEWVPVLRPGVPVLEVSIPEPAATTHEIRRSAFERAHAFFAMYFPEEGFAAFTLQSWLLDPQWEQFLPAQDPLVALQRDFYLLPGVHTCSVAVQWGGDPARLARLREIAAKAGGWRDTPGVILVGDETRESGWYRQIAQDTPWVPRGFSRENRAASP
jgi:hypothetical protein